MITGFTGN